MHLFKCGLDHKGRDGQCLRGQDGRVPVDGRVRAHEGRRDRVVLHAVGQHVRDILREGACQDDPEP